MSICLQYVAQSPNNYNQYIITKKIYIWMQEQQGSQKQKKNAQHEKEQKQEYKSTCESNKGTFDFFGQPEVQFYQFFKSQSDSFEIIGSPTEQLRNQASNYDEHSIRGQKTIQDVYQYQRRQPEIRKPVTSDQHLEIVELKNLSRFMVKNANMPKFLIRIFIRHLKKYRSMYKSEHQLEAAIRKSEQMDKFAKESKQNYLSLKDLEKLFVKDQDNVMDYLTNRRVMHSIIQNEIGKEIFRNPQVKHKLSYAIATKTYALRCFNSILASRVQFK